MNIDNKCVSITVSLCENTPGTQRFVKRTIKVLVTLMEKPPLYKAFLDENGNVLERALRVVYQTRLLKFNGSLTKT